MKNRKKKIVVIACLSVVMALVTWFHPFYAIDRIFMDRFYQQPVTTNPKIKIIGIDEKTLKDYGTFGTWSRDVYATLLENITKDATPSVIGFDITFKSEMDIEGDKAFAEIAKDYDVVVANSVVYDIDVSKNNSLLEVNPFHVDKIEETYRALENVTVQGFSNASLDSDGVIRKAILYVEKEDEIYNSFAYEVANCYALKNNITFSLPVLDSYHRFGIKYSGGSGDFEKISFSDVMSGKVDSRVFDDSIVLIGAYASGMQDAYHTPMEADQKMHGVEIQANIIQSLLSERYYQDVAIVYVLIYTLVVYVIFVCLMTKMSLLNSLFTAILFIIGHIIVAKTLFYLGYEMPLVNLIFGIVFTCILYVVISYFSQKIRAKQIESVLRKYVAPQVVDEVVKDEKFILQPGGVMKDIAVLFVDIRGFTTLSEKLDPAIVVEILNKYLTFTTAAIFKNRGTLDKFIGDATMAVFNSPVDLDDYEYQAIKTALDIAKGSDFINHFTKENYNLSVGFGIGVHCGKAVIGNVGSDVRMDYTAIGDTVNTASRLEGKAKRGQILVSKEVVERLSNRVEFKYVDKMELKGKTEKMDVYEVVRLKEMGELHV